jgi:hypothetical protein
MTPEQAAAKAERRAVEALRRMKIFRSEITKKRAMIRSWRLDNPYSSRRAWSILLRAMLDGQREGRIAARERAWERRRPSLGAQIDRLMERASRRRA